LFIAVSMICCILTRSFQGLLCKCTFVPAAVKKSISNNQQIASLSMMMSDADFDDGAPSDTCSECVPEYMQDVPTNLKDVAALKEQILLSSLGLNRGFSASIKEKDSIIELIDRLELANPNPQPCTSLRTGTSPLTGEWSLVFTNALDVLSLGLLVPVISVGQVYQNINEDGSEITNIVDLQPSTSPFLNFFGKSTVARLRVQAEGEIESDSRISIKFRSTSFEPQSLLGRDATGLPQPKFNIPSARGVAGWIETTYVDETMRVCRAPGNSVFVLIRVKSFL